jgi:hypothetical protein
MHRFLPQKLTNSGFWFHIKYTLQRAYMNTSFKIRGFWEASLCGSLSSPRRLAASWWPTGISFRKFSVKKRHSAISQNTWIFTNTAHRTSNLDTKTWNIWRPSMSTQTQKATFSLWRPLGHIDVEYAQLVIPNVGSRRRRVVNITPRPPYPQERNPLPIKYEVDWGPELEWTFRARQKPLSLVGFEALSVQSAPT